jgi:hypothetical protein
MKTFSHLWQYLVEILLEWEMFQIKVVRKIKTHFMLNNFFFFFRKSCRVWDNVGKKGGAREAADENITWHMRFNLGFKRSRTRKHTHAPTRAHTHAERCDACCFSTTTGFVNVPKRYIMQKVYSYCSKCDRVHMHNRQWLVNHFRTLFMRLQKVFLSWPWSWQVYRVQKLHLPGYSVTAAALRVLTKGALCILQKRGTLYLKKNETFNCKPTKFFSEHLQTFSISLSTCHY